MSLAATLRTAVAGLATAQRALDVTAHNVANASTEGYVRKVHEQEAWVQDGQGLGSRALAPRRVVDEFLVGELRTYTSRLGRSEVLAELVDRAQSLVFGRPGEPGLGLQNRLTALANSFESLANDPTKAAQRVQSAGAVEELATEIARAGEEVQVLRRDADQRIAELVRTINLDVAAIDEINQEIARSRQTAELEDRREKLLASLARKIDIATYRLDDGQVAIYVRGGKPLLEGGRRVLVYEPAPAVSNTTIFGPIELYAARDVDPVTGEPEAGAVGLTLVSGGLRAELPPELVTATPVDDDLVITSPLATGELQGLLEARDRQLPELADQLDELARIVRFALNAAHNAATALPPPESLTGTRIEDGTFDSATRSGTAWLAVVDRATGDTLHTVAIDVSADLATLVAQLDADLAGYGSATIDSEGRLAVALGAGQGIALADGDGAITFTDALGHTWTYGFAHYFGLNDLLVADEDRPTKLALHDEIAGDPARLATFRLDVEPGPPPVSRLGGPGDGRGAQGLAAAFQTTVATVPRGSLRTTSATLQGYATELLSMAAGKAGALFAQSDADRAIVQDLESRVASLSGVNMDEELANLVLYEQGYSVSARIVQITDQLFDELLELAR